MGKQLDVFDGRIMVDTADEKACKLGCKFCFATATPDFYKDRRERGVVDLDTARQRIEELLQMSEVGSINSSCSQELFLDPQFGIEKVRWLAQFGKNVSFPTRTALDEQTMDELQSIDAELRAKTNRLLVAVSMISGKQTPLEGRTSSPQERIQTLQGLRSRGIAAGALVRPILPERLLPTADIHSLIEQLQGIAPTVTIGREFMFDAAIAKRLGISADDKDIAPHITGRNVELGFVESSENWNRYVDPRIADLVEHTRNKGIPAFTSTRESYEVLAQL